MSEGVEILISADDQASAKFAQVAKAAENNVKTIKDVGGKAKASTEFVGQLAGAFGNSEIGSFASQLGGLTEKVSQFSEVSKAGAAGATVFKAGLVAATAYASFNVGKYIGDWWQETEKLKKEMEGVAVKTKESMELFKKFRADSAADRKADIELIKDPEQKKQALRDLTKTLEAELGRQETALKNAKALADKSEKAQSWNYIGNYVTEEKAKADRADAIALEEKTQATREEVTELRRATNGEKERREAILAKIEAETQWQALVAQDRQNTVNERIKEAELAQKEFEDDLKNVELLKKADEDRAAKEKENQLAKQQDQEKQRQMEQTQAEELARRMGEATTNTASESRLLTRGPSQDKTVEVASNTAKANELLAEIPQLIATALAAILPKTKGVQIEKVS